MRDRYSVKSKKLPWHLEVRREWDERWGSRIAAVRPTKEGELKVRQQSTHK